MYHYYCFINTTNMLTISILVLLSWIFIGVNLHLPSKIFKVLATQLFSAWRYISLRYLNQYVTIFIHSLLYYFDMCLYILCSKAQNPSVLYFEIKSVKLRTNPEQQESKQKGGIISFAPEGQADSSSYVVTGAYSDNIPYSISSSIRRYLTIACK